MCCKFSRIGEIRLQLNKIVPATRFAAIKNVRPAHPNAVFFPSAQMKNVRHKPYIPTEMRTIPARTQIAAHPIEVATSDLHRNCTNYIGTNLAVSGNQPRRSGSLNHACVVREWVERCRRDRERFANPHYHVSDSDPFSMTAPARICS